jgi:hypothetical protein
MKEVARYIKPDTWQYCTINSWILGTPSEDDIGFKGTLWSEMPRLEEICGDHTVFGSQYDEAFDDLKSAGAPAAFIKWLRYHKQNKMTLKKGIANVEGHKGYKKSVDAVKSALTWQVGAPILLIGAAFAYAMLREKK